MDNKKASELLKSMHRRDFICSECQKDADECKSSCEYGKAIELAIKALEAQRWIPVSERLPDKFGLYLITDCDGHVMTDVYSNDAKEFQWHDYVTHWRPLPEPYKREETT